MSTVTDIARRRAVHLRVMNAIYEAAEGSRMTHVSGGWLLENLELSDGELGRAGFLGGVVCSTLWGSIT